MAHLVLPCLTGVAPKRVLPATLPALVKAVQAHENKRKHVEVRRMARHRTPPLACPKMQRSTLLPVLLYLWPQNHMNSYIIVRAGRRGQGKVKARTRHPRQPSHRKIALAKRQAAVPCRPARDKAGWVASDSVGPRCRVGGFFTERNGDHGAP